MANIRIEAGVASTAIPNTYLYSYEDNNGFHTVVFTSDTVPKLGDTISGNKLVPRATVPNPSRDELQNGWPQPIINNDPGFQNKKFGRLHPQVWPIEGQDF